MRKDTKSSLEFIFNQLARHPFLCVTSMCILLFFFGFCEQVNLANGGYVYVYAGIVLTVMFALLIVLGRVGKNTPIMAAIFAGMVCLTIAGLSLIRDFDPESSMGEWTSRPALILWLSLVLIAMIGFLMYATGTLTTRNFIMLMIAAGIMLRLVYCLYTGFRDRQHDVGYFNHTWGHANYIEYWYKNGLKLPDYDVRLIWQHYHPPLHHWLMAWLLRLLVIFGMKYETACEAIQFLPFLYSSLIMVISYRIFTFAKLKNLPLAVATAIVCFHPTFVLMGGFFNNDILCVLLMMLAIMFALKWYRKPTLLRIIPIALCVGLGMMTKLNAWMVAPAIAVMFLWVLVRHFVPWLKNRAQLPAPIYKAKWLQLIGQFVVFGVICAPLGLWWPLHNLWGEYQIPITYVPFLNPQDPQYCGDMSVTQRLFDFGHGQTSFVYQAFTDPNFGAPYNEYNPTLGLIKTSLFGEGQNGISDIHFPQIATTGKILFWIGLILGVICFLAFFFMLCRSVIAMIRKEKTDVDGVGWAFFGILAATMLVSYYIFCFKFPFTCTMNIRYCVPLIPLFAMGLGMLLKYLGEKIKCGKIVGYCIAGLVAVFVIMTLIVYTQISVPVPVEATV